MRSTVSIPDALAYDCNESFPDRPEEEADLLQEIHATVHGFAGGTEELARRMKMPLETLRQKANVNNPQHNFRPAELMRLMRCSGNLAILGKLAQSVGCMVQNDRRTFDGDLLQAIAAVQLSFAELVRQVAHLQGDLANQRQDFATTHDENRVRYWAQEVQNDLMGLQAAVAGCKRPAPKAEV